jgi:uncharacterized protein
VTGRGAICAAPNVPKAIGTHKYGIHEKTGDILSTIAMANSIPPEIQGRKYISLATVRKNGVAVRTPVWFGEEDGKLYVMTREISGKYKRIRNNPQVRLAPCTMRGKITGLEFAGTVRILRREEWPRAIQSIRRKYWAARIPWLWRKTDAYLEIAVR